MAVLIATVSVAGGQAAVALSLGGSHSHRPALRNVADVTSAGPLKPFAATPEVIPLQVARPTPRPTTSHLPSLALAASAPLTSLPTDLGVTAGTIPRPVLAAYVNAVKLADKADPHCRLQWQSLAGIGFVESDNALAGGSANPHWNGVAFPPILGPVLDGTHGVAAVPDTDGGALDGNSTWDRAVGPMQFIPSTWARYAADGDHDGVANPEDINDATLAAADYLCATGPDLNHPKPLIRAIFAYNHSYDYVRAVLTVSAHYADINPATLGIDGLPGAHKMKKKGSASGRHHRLRSAPLPVISAPNEPGPSGPSGSPSPAAPSSPTPTPSGSPAASEVSPSATAPVAGQPFTPPDRPAADEAGSGQVGATRPAATTAPRD